jgi:hypothetical protein
VSVGWSKSDLRSERTPLTLRSGADRQPAVGRDVAKLEWTDDPRGRDDTLPDNLQRLPWIEKPVRFEQLLGALDQAANEKTHEQRVSRNLDRAMGLYDITRHGSDAMVYGGHDARECGLNEAGNALYLMNYPERALASIRAGLEHALTIDGAGRH